MRTFTTTCSLLVSALLFLGSAPAEAQTFTLTPTCPAPCGSDYLGPVWTKPSNAIYDSHTIDVRLTAATLLRSTSQHLAKTLLATNPKLLLKLEMGCLLGDCSVSANLYNDQTGALLASVTGKAVVSNPTATRNIWYSVTKFANETVAPSVTFQVLGQTYFAG
ncbi:hypothetical protein CYFUS_004530 [Cystobacter fuscus]|uniref:Lipoprotein n=1 Tax=Cystobacter fuscus TaxID=43 RepID=A0A250J6N1_9BACT|nr:hypothetical protein [Cystobacter fuscus]ATB39091.1 hypothetical protein CYFUS_004530 [Cystobacter fuscus]